LRFELFYLRLFLVQRRYPDAEQSQSLLEWCALQALTRSATYLVRIIGSDW
jgi:hypothetical protein